MNLKRSWLFCLLALFAVLSGCAGTQSILTPQSYIGNKDVVTPYWNTVYLLTPKVTFEDVRTERDLSDQYYSNAKATSKNLVEVSGSAILQKGFRFLQENNLTLDQKIELNEVLLALGNQPEDFLKKGKDKGVFLPNLQKLHNVIGTEALMVQILKIKVGGGSFWDPLTGIVTPGTSTSHILAFLVDVKTGEVVWRNEVFFRTLPETEILNKSLEILFSKFPAKEGETR